MTHLPRAFLLDLDDTIVDDSSNVVACWRDACLAHAKHMGSLDPAALHESIERTRDWFWSDAARHREGRLDLDAARRRVVALALERHGVTDDDLAGKIATRYGLLRESGIRAIEGSIETVHWLRAHHVRTALLTNGNAEGQRAKIARFHLEELFDAILIEGELGYGKPDARVYARALEALDVAPEHTHMVGDNLEWDVAGPQRQGIRGIWIDKLGAGVPVHLDVCPHRVIRRLSELRAP